MIWANAIICMIWAGIQSSLKAAPGCQKSSPSYQFNSLNFDSKKLSVRSVEDHLNIPNTSQANIDNWFVFTSEMHLFKSLILSSCNMHPLWFSFSNDYFDWSADSWLALTFRECPGPVANVSTRKCKQPRYPGPTSASNWSVCSRDILTV